MDSVSIGFVVLIGWLVAASPVAAEPLDFAARMRLEEAVTGLGDPLMTASLRQEANRIMIGLGLPTERDSGSIPASVPDFVSTDGAVVELVDLRLLLTQIAIQTGASDHLSLVRAQGERDQKVILLRGGFATLTELFALSRDTPAADFIEDTAEGIVISRPLAVWSDAGLHLAATDRLTIERQSGSFIANLGWLDIAGATVSGSDALNVSERGFRPFILTAGTGSLTVQGAVLQGLGVGDTSVFGGVSVVNNGLTLPLFPSQIWDTTLIDITTLSFLGTQGVTVSGNHLFGSEGTAILVSQSQDALIAGNTLAELSGPQAIRVTEASHNITLTDNILTDGARTGILIDRDSFGVTIEKNIVFAQVTTGITVSSSTCISLRANLIAANGASGVTINAADAISLSDNAILFNDSAAVLIRDQGLQAAARLSDNVLIGNREGFRGATPGLVVLEGNDLEGQLPRVFTGDLAPLTVDWLRDGRVDLTTASLSPPTAPCANQGQG